MENEKRIIHGDGDDCNMAEVILQHGNRLSGLEKDMSYVKKNQEDMIENDKNILSKLEEVGKYSTEFRVFLESQLITNNHIGKAVDKLSDMCDRFDQRQDKIDQKQYEQSLEIAEIKFGSEKGDLLQDLKREQEKNEQAKEKFGNQVADAVKKHWIKLAAAGASGGILYTFYQMAQTFAQIADAMPK